MRLRKPWVLTLIIFGAISCCPAAEPGFVSIFDGKTLNGWSSDDMSYWSVEDGAIAGRGTKDIPYTRWLVWQGGEMGDFEFKLKFRLSGGTKENPANSGIQFRCIFNSVGTNGILSARTGYQADIALDPDWMGLLYSASRAVLAERGQKVVIDKIGGRRSEDIGDPAELYKLVNVNGWNDYHVIAMGNHFQAVINGHLMSEVIDGQTAKYCPTGWIGLQIEHGPPMEVHFKDIRLKKY